MASATSRLEVILPVCQVAFRRTADYGACDKHANYKSLRMLKDRIQNLLSALNQGIYEKENEVALSLLAAVAGESIILLGPPGVAKSMVARRLSMAFVQSKSFEYLMSRFSTPDEIFGPVSISKLKDSDNYERVTEGYLPTADVVFLDEIWKAGPAIQNTLLTVINEKVFRNGNQLVHLPLKLLIAASNELPAQGEGLEALWDRLIVRLESKNIRKEDNFDRMLLDDTDENVAVPKKLQITRREYAHWSKDLDKVGVEPGVLRVVHQLRRSLQSVAIDGSDERRAVYVSDRRWKNIVRLLRASAFLQDREVVGLEDLLPVYNCLWQEPEERDEIRRIVVRALFMAFNDKLEQMKRALAEDIKMARAARAANRISSRKLERDADKKLYDEFYYKLVGYPDGDCYIMARDYQSLPMHGTSEMDTEGILYQDGKSKGANILRAYDGSFGAPLGSAPVMLNRDEDHVYVLGDRYAIEKTTEAKLPLGAEMHDSGRNYEREIDDLADELKRMEKGIQENIFLSEDDKRRVAEYVREIYQNVAFTRQDTLKLYD